MTSKPVEVRVPITELPTLVERKSKQTKIFSKEEPSLKVVFFAESLCKNQSKCQIKENCRGELDPTKLYLILLSMLLSRVVFKIVIGKESSLL